jgi:Ca-activated chloride channel family protein
MRSISATTGGRFFLGQDEKQLAAVYTALDAIIPQNFKTQSYRPKRQLFMYPLGAAVLLVLVFQMAMLGWTFAVRRLARRNSFDAAGEARRSPT